VVALLLYLAVAASGIYAGAMLTEAEALVPYWRTISPAAFFAWYAANGDRLFGYFAPVTIAALLGTVAAAGGATWTGHPGRRPAAVAAVLVLATGVMFPLYFQGVNARFATAAIPPDDVAPELARWAAWHWVRTVLALVAFVAALLAVRADTRRA
jgi:hypothetical protein